MNINENEIEMIDLEQAKLLIDQNEVTLADIRDISAFNEGHIKGSQNINDENIEEFISNTSKDKPLLCVCYRGFSSQDAAKYFLSKGFKKTYSLNGGMEAWSSQYPTVNE